MALLGWSLACLSALCWLSLDILRKRLTTQLGALEIAAGLMLLHIPLAGPLLLAGQLLDDQAPGWLQTLAPALSTPSWEYFAWSAGSLVLNAAANYLFLRSVQLAPLSQTTPLLALTPVFAILASMAYGESITGWGALGIALVVLGAFALQPPGALDTTSEQDPTADKPAPLSRARSIWRDKGSRYMLFVAMIWGLSPALDKAASQRTTPLFHTVALAAALGLAFLLAAISRPEASLAKTWRAWRSAPWLLFFAGLFSVGGTALQLHAFDYIEIAYVDTLKRSIGVLGALIAGYLLFAERERLGPKLLAGAMLCAGVAMVLLLGRPG